MVLNWYKLVLSLLLLYYSRMYRAHAYLHMTASSYGNLAGTHKHCPNTVRSLGKSHMTNLFLQKYKIFNYYKD